MSVQCQIEWPEEAYRMRMRIEYEVPPHVAPLFVQVPRWNGRLNVYRGRPDENPHNPLGEAVIWSMIHRRAAERVPTPPLVPGFRWNHEIERS